MLGEVQIEGARGSVDSGRARKLSELAAYLVLCPGKSTAALTADIWPYGTTMVNRNVSVTRLRAWLGRDEAGELYYPNGQDGNQFSAAVGCDLFQFRALHERGARARRAGDLDEATTYFEAALSLVRGRPFASAERTGYRWAEATFPRARAEIVDAATHLAEIRMAEQAWSSAAAVAAKGMIIGPDSGDVSSGYDALLRLRLDALSRAGDVAELERLAAEQQYSDVEQAGRG